MSADPDAQAFIPKGTKTVTIGKETVSLYDAQINDPSLSKAEKTYAFNQNKVSLESSSISPKQKINTLASTTGTSSIAMVMMNHWNTGVKYAARAAGHLIALSYHGRNGVIINTATLADGITLRPTNGVDDNNRRAAGIQYVKVRANLEFTTCDPTCQKRVPFEYFIQVPMVNQAVLDNNGQPVDLTTWHIDANWAAGDQAAIDDVVGGNANRAYPFDLSSSTIDDAAAGAVITSLADDLADIAYETAWPYITQAMYKQVSPGIQADPALIIQNIAQVSRPSGASVDTVLSVEEYFTHVSSMTMFLDPDVFQMDVVHHFVGHLKKDIRTEMESNGYRYNSLVTGARQANKQMQNLQLAYEAAILAENKHKTIRDMTREVVSGHAFHNGVHTYASIAESTLEQYGPGTVTEKKNGCWGCLQDDHSYAGRNGVIYCPNKDKPGVKERAEQARRDYNTRLKSSRKKKRKQAAQAKANNSAAATPTAAAAAAPAAEHAFNGLTKAQLIAALLSSNKEDTANTKRTKTISFTVAVLIATDTAKKMLPIAVDSNLPHCNLALGTVQTTMGDNRSPAEFKDIRNPAEEFEEIGIAIENLFDTGSAICLGKMEFHLRLAKRFPSTVKALIWAKDEYSAIVLSGIIAMGDGNGQSLTPTALLQAVIIYYLPYLTVDGYQTTIAFALGKDVSVNSIIGMPFIRSAKLSLDMNDEVIQSGVLATEPFPVTFKRTTNSLPDFSSLEKATGTKNVVTIVRTTIPTCKADMMSRPVQFDSRHSTSSNTVHHEQEITTDTIDRCWAECNLIEEITADDQTIISSNSSQMHKDDPRSAGMIPSFPMNAMNKEEEANKSPDERAPIVVPKPKWRPKTPSLWKENVTDDDEGFEYVFQSRSSCTLRRPTKDNFPQPNPAFAYTYNESADSKELFDSIVLGSHLSVDVKNRVVSFVKEFWDVFRAEGVKVPIQGYEMVIDTGDHPPIAVRKPRYGLHESPIIQKTIDKLLLLGHIIPDSTSPWGFAVTLAPKPHQEHITDIEDYVWRFCTNYIRLNMITRPAEYPIPRCDDAVMFGFGRALFFILLDAFSGYHQVRLSKASAIKTAFYAPHGRKFIWVVMPFGLRNCPVVFVAMMHDLKDLWMAECEKEGVKPSHDEGTTIIIDDTLMYGVTEDNAFIIARCVCLIARKYHLTWKLQKCQWFPESVEFVGVDINKSGGNSPAKSKHVTIRNWKMPQTPRDILSFVSFAIFYLKWVPWFELKVQPLRAIISKWPLDHLLNEEEFNNDAIAVYEYLREYLLSSPMLQRASIHKRFYLKADFSALSVGYALCQPDDNLESIAAMEREDKGGPCEFDLCQSKMRLKPVAFGSRKTVGNEKHYHSHPGESLAASWAITKNRQFLWGRPFTLMTDCRALLWLFNYKGHNHAVRRLQLEMAGYWFTIVNRPGRMMEDANYFSRLGQDTHVDPLLNDYLSFARQLYENNEPTQDPLGPNNMPGLRMKRQKTTSSELDAATSTVLNVEWDYDVIDVTPELLDNDIRVLSNVPVIINTVQHCQPASKNHFSYVTESAVALTKFRWCLSQPGHGHFIEASRMAAINFEVAIAYDSDPAARTTIQERFGAKQVFSSLAELSNFVETATNRDEVTTTVGAKDDKVHSLPIIHGYYAHVNDLSNQRSTSTEIHQHINIIFSLGQTSHLRVFCLEVPSTLSTRAYNSTIKSFENQGWLILERSFRSTLDFSDRVEYRVRFIVGMNPKYHPSLSNINEQPLTPTPAVPNAMTECMVAEYDEPRFAIPYVGELFEIEQRTSEGDPRQPLVESIVTQKEESLSLSPASTTRFQVFNRDHPAPETPRTLATIFGSLFGVSFRNPAYTAENNEPDRLVRSIALSEYTACYGYSSEYSNLLAIQPEVARVLTRTAPSRLMTQVVVFFHNLFTTYLDEKCEAVSVSSGLDISIPSMFGGIIRDSMPTESAWKEAYRLDEDCAAIIGMINDPSIISADSISKIHYTYRAPMRASQLKWEDERLVLHEPVAHSNNTVRLTIVPKDLRRHVFSAFHANPLGGHYSLYYTLHRIRLRFHWPNMFKYIKNLIDSCAGCLLKNGARAASEILYSFPVIAPFMTVHADVWVPGKTMSFDGFVGLMIVMCHMTGFAAIQPLRELNSTSFAKSVYTILLRYGLANMIVTDEDSKFKGEFKKAFKVLEIQHHVCAKGNHNAMLVERFNRYLNAGLRVHDNDRGTNRVFVEGAELLAYAWNSCPVLGTDLSRSLLAVGREFHFPIDFAARRHFMIDPTDSAKKSFAKDILDLMEKSQFIYKLLIDEHRAAHREYRNAQINNPRKFKLNDVVFTNVQVQSKAAKGTVEKLAYKKRGPYKVIKDYNSGSYELQLLNGQSKTTIKKHGSDLYLSPHHLEPHKMMQSSDKAFSELDRKVVDHPYSIIGIDNYTPIQPWKMGNSDTNVTSVQRFPSVEELDNEFDNWPSEGNPFVEVITPIHSVDDSRPQISRPQIMAESNMSVIPDIATLVRNIIQSEDRLFFIARQCTPTSHRREWKLVRVDLKSSMEKNPACLQNGSFIAEFLLEHYRDKQLLYEDKRFWLEYHHVVLGKQWSDKYHLLQPSDLSTKTAKDRNLQTYREWVNFNDPAVYVHGPFEFATLNRRKTRDRVSLSDWQVLVQHKGKYHDAPPRISQGMSGRMAVNLIEPIYEPDLYLQEVQTRIMSLLTAISHEDNSVHDY